MSLTLKHSVNEKELKWELNDKLIYSITVLFCLIFNRKIYLYITSKKPKCKEKA